MPTIGAPLRKWTLFLLLFCSVLLSAAHAANDTHTREDGATASQSTTTPRPTTASPSSSWSSPSSPSSSSAPRKYIDTETLCPFRTINYITHTLPQQCAKTSWSAPGDVASPNATVVEPGATPSPQGSIGEREGRDDGTTAITSNPPQPEASDPAESAIPSGTKIADTETELETDSPFDNANFLSFEEWKMKNLAQVGQSPENVGQGRAAASNQATRRRPVNVNALDSLGDEAEIEIDFSGFGNPEEGDGLGSNPLPTTQGSGIPATEGDGKAAPSSWALSKDAGKTCKERFNYASFDCAATVLKTNKLAKSSSSILVENKDSYMLNQCSADNKFLIVELCDDILVDTIVLANYEFFSSMFRHFRVSVSDRYPVKMERWRTLGTFEARNSRDIQAFLITEPQIWARYLRVEFLTHYGNEFYCPLSLLRVHGTTMMEQFRREEEEARGVDDDEELDVASHSDLVKPVKDSGPLPPDQIPVQPKDDSANSDTIGTISTSITSDVSSSSGSTSSQDGSQNSSTESPVSQTTDGLPLDQTISNEGSSTISAIPTPPSPPSNLNNSNTNSTALDSTQPSGAQSSEKGAASPQVPHSPPNSSVTSSSPTQSHNGSSSSSTVNDTTSSTPNGAAVRASSDSINASPSSQMQTRGSATQPNIPTPSTQESFFKSIHKRLQYLEANSTLSLQYIEEQSRILRDAFVKVEKRQLAKTEKFLDHLNNTVMHELKSYRNMYDQLWQSTIIELESMKERQRSEIGEIGTRLSLMADELVWQKRMAVVQSTLLLLCLGLVLFVRSGTLGSTADVPIVQQLGSKYTSFFEASPPRSPETSGLLRRRRTFRSMWRSDTSAGLSDELQPPSDIDADADTDGARSTANGPSTYNTPALNTPAALAARDVLSTHIPVLHTESPSDSSLASDDQARRVAVLETQSGPATPNGTRDCRPSWEEVDRAMDLLKAEEEQEQEQEQQQGGPPRRKKKVGLGKEKRSPLRRAHSNFEG
ncbi:hypothetical protein IQ07DRAFT_537156, partial [Pyrenochaeta sp. DS3sAY3a]